MQEFNIIVDIDENGNIKAETKGISGETCVSELDEILKGLEGEKNFKNKPEFYKKESLKVVSQKTVSKKS
jgi:hypothetical protein